LIEWLLKGKIFEKLTLTFWSEAHLNNI
jgi:hypothetical protein